MIKDNRRTIRALDDVWNERLRQDQKWGEQNHSNAMWSLILGEEFGEACKSALDGNKFVPGFIAGERAAEADLREELVQVAAVAVAWIECIDRRR